MTRTGLRSALLASFKASAPAMRPSSGSDGPAGQVYGRPVGAARLDCFFYFPKMRDLSRAPLVCVHGISRNALEHVFAFRQQADALGFPVIAPVFDRKHYRGYQTLGSKHDWNALSAFDAALDDVEAAAGARSFNLFGFSGGGQFIHRFAMARPARVRALATASAGWYTFPGDEARFPRGLAGKIPHGADHAAFLKLPMLVIVGSEDRERDPALRQGWKIDAQQGADRVERARNWAAAVNDAARNRVLPPPATYAELAGATHSFSDCVAAGLARRVTEFFFQPKQRETCASPGDPK